MRSTSIAPLAAIALAALAGCGHGEEKRLAAPPMPAQSEVRTAENVREARQFIKDRLEAEVMGYRVKVDTLQLVTPAFEGEYVFVANTTTTQGAHGPVLAWERVIGSAYLGPKKKFHIWKERPIAPTEPSPSPSAAQEDQVPGVIPNRI